MSDEQQTVRFLQALFGDRAPDGTRIALWAKADKRSIYIERPGEAAGQEGATDVYVTAGLVPGTLDVRRRLKARECAGIPGVWVDIDVDGGPDNKTGVCPTREDADRLARIELEPTVLVNSGYGLQAWWLFDDVWTFGMGEERERAARVTQGWETIHRNHARRKGHGLDSTHDLARLMRLPGTFNGKGTAGESAPVIIVELDGPRYSLDAIAERALTVAPIGVAEVKVDPQAGFPRAKFEGLVENHDFFRKTWNHQRKDRAAEGWSMSEYDMALASIAAGANWTDDEIAALIREHRIKQGDPEKGQRADYLQKTIEKARLKLRRTEQERLRTQAYEDVAAAHEAGTLTADIAYSKFNQGMGAGVNGAPVIKELIQYSDDPEEARYVFVLDDGREVNVGPYENLREPRKLDRRLGPACGFVMPVVKDNEEWRGLVGGLLEHRRLHDDPESQILTWLGSYLEGRVGASRDEATKVGEPFEEEDLVFVKPSSLAHFIRVTLRERVKTADLWPMLRQAGFERQTVHHENKNGGRTTSTYWAAARGELEQ